MGPRRKHTKEESLQLWSLIREWKIDFESASTLRDWNARHLPSKQIFEQILEIKTVTFVEYPGDQHLDKEAAGRKKVLVKRLQANAARCRREKDNEAGWVNNVANLVFESLNGFEFRCQVCDAYLWLPDFVPRPGDPIAVERLLRDYRSRKICGCSAIQRAAAVRVRPDSPSIFSNKSDEQVFHTSPGLQKVTVDQKYKRPDRVYGLSVTRSFDRFVDRLGMYSPFIGSHTLFPFMVVEAKSEKSDAGFHDIEQQTALSIRTCLKIQTDLEMESNQVLDPLVWFFGFRGDEWRLYVALPINDRTKVIDCWHGCISKADEALQLLLIVDWICFWARDVHRKGVLKCLSGLEARDLTPAATVFSSQGEWTDGRNSTRSSSLVVRGSRPDFAGPERNPQNPSNIPIIDLLEIEDEIMRDAVNNDSSVLGNNTDGSDYESGESSLYAVRSALDTVFRWKYFELPEDDAGMLECLSAIVPSDSTQHAARALWEMVTDESSTVKMSLKSISELLHNSTEKEATQLSAEEPVATFLACQHRLAETSWQVMCTYWCITCSQAAAHLLAMKAGIADAEVFPLNLWRAQDCDCLISAVGDIQRLSGKASAAAAISQDISCIRTRPPTSTGRHLEWYKGDEVIFQPRVAMLEALFKHVEGAQQTSLPVAAICTSGGDALLSSQLFATDDLRDVPGVILKKPKSWPATCPLWCFLTFGLGGRGRESIGRQIAVALQQKAIFAAEGLDPTDEVSISEWAMATEDVMQSIDVSHR